MSNAAVVQVRNVWRKVRPCETSMGCILCGGDTEIIHDVEIRGMTPTSTCYCRACSPVVPITIPDRWWPWQR